MFIGVYLTQLVSPLAIAWPGRVSLPASQKGCNALPKRGRTRDRKVPVMTTAPSPGTGRLALTDDVLAEALDTALQLAWEGLTAQTTPVGAVVVTEAGEVVAAGRGRRYEPSGPAGQLAGTSIAHAEVNALAQLPSARRWQDFYLLTTLEPCGMCHGAAIQSRVAGIYFAGRDPYGGTASLRFENPQALRQELLIDGPLPGTRGALAEIMHVTFLMNRDSAAHVIRAHTAAMPQLTCYTRRNRDDLNDAVSCGDYQRAAAIAEGAPRDH